MATITFRLTDSILDDIKNLLPLASKSVIIREALKMYFCHLKNKDEMPSPLPGWQHFEKLIRDSDDKKFKTLYDETKHLMDLADFYKKFRKERSVL